MRASCSVVLAIASFASASAARADPEDDATFVGRAPSNERARGTQSGLEAGWIWTHMENTTNPGGWRLSGNAIRAGAYAADRGHGYLRFEIDVGTLSGTGQSTGTPFQSVARTQDATATSTTMSPSDGATVGRFVQAKVAVGLRALRGPVGGAVELAAGVRNVTIGDTRYVESTASQVDAIIEARARVDLWLGRGVTIGGIAGINALQTSNITLGVMLGGHLPR
jgi:hypothetical protein